MKFGGFADESIIILIFALPSEIDRNVEKDSEVRPEAAGCEIVEATNCFEIEAAAEALVGKGGITKAIADHRPAVLDGGSDYFHYQLGPGSEEEQKLGRHREHFGAVEKKPA